MRRLHRILVDVFNSRPFTLLLLAGATVFCVVATVVTHSHAAALRDHGQRTVAVVRSVHDEGDDYYVTVQFTTQAGVKVVADVENYEWSPEPRAGDTPTVIYDPDDPSGNVADARIGPDFLASWLIGAGGLLTAVLFVLTYLRRIDWRGMAKDQWGY